MTTPNADKNKIKEENKEQVDYNETDVLLERYDKFLEMLDYRNTLYYGALFRELFSDFATEEEGGKIDKSIEDLAKLLDKACEKLNFDLCNASMKQVHKLYTLLIQKLNGTNAIRSFDLDKLQMLLFRMYTDDEVLEMLTYFDKKGVKPEHISAINEKDEVVFVNKKKYKLKPSKKLEELLEVYETLQVPSR
jgi:hypothetical protein